MVFIQLIVHASGGKLTFPDLAGIYLERFIAKSISASITAVCSDEEYCGNVMLHSAWFSIAVIFLFMRFLKLLSAEHSVSI